MTRHKVMVVLAGTMIAMGAGMPPAAATPAGDSALPAGWQVQAEFDNCTTLGLGGEIYGVTATGPDNAWAAGQCGGGVGPGPDSALVAHWDGTSWRLLHPLADSVIASAVASLSGSYTWVFVERGSQFPFGHDYAMLWQNGRWQRFQLADNSRINSAVAFSRSNAWGFGTDGGGTYAVRFNGHSWRRVPIPVVPLAVAAPIPDRIWAVGPPSRAAGVPDPKSYVLARWTGAGWKLTPFPAISLPTGDHLGGASIVTGAPGGGAFIAVQFSPFGGVLLRWTGAIWQNVNLPGPEAQVGPLAHDGQGGLWVASIPVTSPNSTDDVVMLHYSAFGQLSQTVVPVAALVLNTMRLIPGTTSVWAAGFVSADCDPDGDSCLTPTIVHGP